MCCFPEATMWRRFAFFTENRDTVQWTGSEVLLFTYDYSLFRNNGNWISTLNLFVYVSKLYGLMSKEPTRLSTL